MEVSDLSVFMFEIIPGTNKGVNSCSYFNHIQKRPPVTRLFDLLRKMGRIYQFCGQLPCLSGVEVNQEQQFTVDTKGAGGQGQLQVAVVSLCSSWFFFSQD